MPVVSAVVLFAILSLAAGPDDPDLHQTVTVCVEPGAAAPSLVTQAQAIASTIFASAGFRLDWGGHRECKTPRVDTILVRLADGTSSQRPPGVLGYARPYAASSSGVEVEVYYDRVMRTVEPERWRILLGHVLA